MLADRIEALNALLVAAEEAHGKFEATELSGVYDQEWARWYAGYAVEHGIGDMLGRDVTTDQLAQFLGRRYADFKRMDPKPSEPWAAYTARRIAADLSHAGRLTPKQFQEADGVEDWRIVGEGACVYFPTASMAASARLVQAIGDLPDVDEHPPAVDLRWGGVTVRLITVAPDYMGMTERDLEVARQISDVARGLGLSADPSAVQSFLVIPGAPDIAEVMPFWQAVLGYEPRADSPDEDLVDPRDRGPSFWFETMEEPRPGGGGAIHVAIWVPFEQAEARITAALAAGGRMVRDDFAPSWWTLADSAGNEADIATTKGRD
jgi:4a-hydroxytetrahydrobiopterin dehydratase